jgi:hypothetical protein
MRKTCVVALALFLPVASPVWAQRREMQKTLIQGDTMYTLMEPGGIPAIFNPVLEPAAQDDSAFAPDEPLLVVEVDGEVRAYSTWHLDEHEVVNDTFGRLPLAVTW